MKWGFYNKLSKEEKEEWNYKSKNNGLLFFCGIIITQIFFLKEILSNIFIALLIFVFLTLYFALWIKYYEIKFKNEILRKRMEV